jgi:hypothetical protein
VETPLPDWVVIGESVLVRPYSYSGVIAYVGLTEFASGNWIGVELDAPTGTDRNTHLNNFELRLTRTLSVTFYNAPLSQARTMVLLMVRDISRVGQNAAYSLKWIS